MSGQPATANATPASAPVTATAPPPATSPAPPKPVAVTATPTNAPPPKKKFRILSLDGGGVRAMIQARLLLRIVEAYPQFMSQIDLITGTSAGSIVGMALANGVPPDKVSSWFETEVPKIFSETYSKEMWSLWNTIAAQFDTSELRLVLEKQIGNKVLSDIKHMRVLIPTFNLHPELDSKTNTEEVPMSPVREGVIEKKQEMLHLKHSAPVTTKGEEVAKPSATIEAQVAAVLPPLEEKASKPAETKIISEATTPSHLPLTHPAEHKDCTPDFTNRWKPEFLHNFPSSVTADTPIVDAVLRSTAAPTYFPIYQGYVDGGTFANNPSLAALTTSVHYGIPLEDIVVLSLGTGFNPTSLGPKDFGEGNWGMFQWAPHLINLLIDANTEAITYQTQILLNERVFRLNPLLPHVIGLGDATAVPELKHIGDTYDLTGTKAWLEKVWGANEALPIVEEEHLEEKGGSYCSIQ